jgi:hypothetical protein
LVNTGRLAGSISGGRQEKALYVPDIYTKSQNDWVDSFYKQNGYLGKEIKLINLVGNHSISHIRDILCFEFFY